jgi:hypothetical protein
MPAKSLNASPSSTHRTFDSHSILAQFEPSHRPEVPGGHASPAEDQQSETTQDGTSGNSEVPVNELGIYEAPTYIEDCLSPLEAFNETAATLATHVPEEPLYQEPPGHVRSPILSK